MSKKNKFIIQGCPKYLNLISPKCPWYIQFTSYGAKWIKCENKECKYRKWVLGEVEQ